MESVPKKLGNSAQEQKLLRAATLWAASYAEEALTVYEDRHPDDMRPREAIEAGQEFGRGKKRDKALRILAMAAWKAGKDVDEPSKYAARAASLIASVAYAHTDLQAGLQGVRQARHVLGPVVYAALAIEMASGGDHNISENILQRAIDNALSEVRYILEHMPPQPKKGSRLDLLFFEIDSALRS
jgi:hypothetical protein